MQIYTLSAPAITRLAANRSEGQQSAENGHRRDLEALDRDQAMAPEVKRQQVTAQSGLIAMAEQDSRLANGIKAVVGTAAGTALDIWV